MSLMDRLHAMHLDRRLPAGQLTPAADAGLQDTAPHAGLLSLHARVEGIAPDSWEHPSLAQVWGPRLAVYLVPADAVAAFTLGRLPRDAAARRRIEALSDRVLAVLNGRPMRSNELFHAFPDLPNPVLIRGASATGRFLPRWDARTTVVVPVEAPNVDVEDARIDLARRFAAWFGAASGAASFARWAGIGIGDVTETWRRVEPCTPPRGAQPHGVRLLPYGDPFLYGQVTPQAEAGEIPGALLVDGKLVGSWARRQGAVTLRPTAPLSAADLARVAEAAHALRGPLGRTVRVMIA